MKKYLVTQICLFLLFIFTFQFSFAQMKIGTFFGINYWGETDNNQKIEAIGIGEYANSNVRPNAALDITIPYLFVNSPPLIYPGEAIRSTAEADYNHTWKMFTYPDKEKFHVMNPKTTPDIDLNVLQRGNLNFFTDNTLGRMLCEG